MDIQRPDVTEEQIDRMVRLFYSRAREDAELGPVFAAHVDDWEHHFQIVQNFWSQGLLGTGRYKGSPYSVHLNLGIKIEHFARWLELFRAAAAETLPPDAAKMAISRAEHMSKSFKVGLFPLETLPGMPHAV
ncbi:group III truncated hemoglobin [Derxia gummosa]|uniref:Group III truncated hemoglobin n=1 Tax=Derxia gummosa DSM 723 TaxID=1121388 RepID=A0A8B6X6N5_9BURK|nr:group III truncated hemoglobin [Derxia gummosa]